MENGFMKLGTLFCPNHTLSNDMLLLSYTYNANAILRLLKMKEQYLNLVDTPLTYHFSNNLSSNPLK